MMQRSIFRVLLSATIMAVAGLSASTGVFPTVMSLLFSINSFEVMLLIKGFVIPLALLWAIGGGFLGWHGGAQLGVLIMGSCGAISGLILGIVALHGSIIPILVGILFGTIYGAIAGLLIGKAFPKTISQPQ